MTREILNCSKVLMQLDIAEEEIKEVKELFHSSLVLDKVLATPTYSEKTKEHLVGTIMDKGGFSVLMKHFLQEMCRIGMIVHAEEIMDGYQQLMDEKEGIVRAVIIHVGEDTPEGRAAMQKVLEERYRSKKFIWRQERDDSILGGYIMKCPGHEYDASYQNQLRRLKQRIIRR